MAEDDPLKIARLIAQAVTTDTGRTPVERVLLQYSQSISAWREMGWTWSQIAALLTKGGLRLKNGTAVTDRYLAAVFSRIQAKIRSKVQKHADMPLEIGQHTPASQVVSKAIPFTTTVPPSQTSKPAGSYGAEKITKKGLRARMAAAAKVRSHEF